MSVKEKKSVKGRRDPSPEAQGDDRASAGEGRAVSEGAVERYELTTPVKGGHDDAARQEHDVAKMWLRSQDHTK